jgi:tetratricopeptide (TPR) repeat protein/glycosyltransferase involved in cell wall biosynthesis
MMLRPDQTGRLRTSAKEPDPSLLLEQALALRKNGRLGKAGRLCLQIIAKRPDHFDALHLLGLVRHEQGRDAEALELFASALNTNPRSADALSNSALVLARLGRHEEALKAYDEALTIRPDHAAVLYNRGYPLLQLRRFEEALANYERAIALKPDFAEAFDNRGNVLQQLNRPDEALASYEAALSFKPSDANTLNNRGTVLRDLGRLDEALASYDRALALKSDYPDALSNRGLLLCEFRRFDEALASYDRAIALGGDHADARFNKAICQLLQGDFVEGWRGYEQRWRRRGANPPSHTDRPLWLGDEALAGQTILLHAEQGFGDTIQFVRYAHLVQERGARVILEVQPPLKESMATLSAAVEVFAQGEALPEFDCQCPLLSLPLAFATTAATIPSSGPYLAAQERRLRRWQKRLGDKTRPRIGIAWSGAGGHRKHRDRSIALKDLGDLFDLPVEWLCLLREIYPSERALLQRFKRLRQFTEAIADFADTAALVACCDLVISIDTAVAHLAGAMGKPVWILLNYVPDWRWLLDRQDSPWYPTARLFRQQQLGDWSDVIRRISQELQASSSILNGGRIDATRLVDEAIAHHRSGRLTEAERVCSRILEAQPKYFDAIHLLGAIRHRQGRHGEALDLLDSALAIRPDDAQAFHNRGNALKGLGRLDEAVASYDRALAIRPEYADALNNRGNALRELGRADQALADYDKALAVRPNYLEAHNNRAIVLLDLEHLEEALASLDRALAVRPDHAQALNNRAIVLLALKRFDEAVASCDRALASRPDYPEALINRGAALRELERFDEALASCDRALAIRPDSPEALNNRGTFLLQLERLEEALASCDRALAIRPDYPDALSNRGAVFVELKRFEEALTSCERALAMTPDYVEALNNRGNALLGLKRLDHALADYDRALVLRPDYTEAHTNRGNVLRELKRYDEALASYGRALAFHPDDVAALSGRGAVLRELKRFDEVLATYEQMLAVKPDHRYALGHLLDAALQICDWERTAKLADDIAARIMGRRSAAVPFTLLGACDDPALHLQCVRNFVEDEVGISPPALCRGTGWRHDRIRLAYLSADFHGHATAYLMAELFELHDRSRFEVAGISFGGADGGETRTRLVKAFDKFHDVRTTSDLEVARLMGDLEIDIAVDLKGYTRDSRAAILAHRPAPIQVSYLGYPGTMGAEFIDYVIADPIVLPLDQQPFYTEKIVHLPESYQVNDSKRKIGEGAPTRREARLPDNGFVFCCFNNNYKITAPVFDVWMRLLGAVDNSVLWLLRSNEAAERNLRKEAAARGIDPTRLVFAESRPLDEHLARHRLADLFLDTLPYNAHTTASDALWAGLPVLTCAGRAFAGRVAASLLTAVGVAELVTDSLEAYEALALRLARDPSLLGGLRAKLAQNRLTHPLFDTDRFRRHIEAAYVTMWEIWQRGESPRSFSVPAEESAEAAVTTREDGMELHRSEEAVMSSDKPLEIEPDDAASLRKRGSALLQLKRLDEALASYDCALALEPDHVDALNGRGCVLMDLKRLDEAVASFDRALATRPDFSPALYNRGVALHELQRFDEALESFEKATGLKRDYAEAFSMQGIVLAKLGRLDDAIASYDRALAIQPQFADALNNRGNALRELKRLGDAVVSYDRALAVRPDFPAALNNRGNVFLELKQPHEALATYDRALAIQPEYADALNNRGNALKDLGQAEEALASYDRALAIRPNYTDALNNRGNVLLELKRFEEALESYDRSVELDPEHAEHRFNRSLLLLLLGSFGKGWQEYEWRRKTKIWAERTFEAAEWTGENISGKRVLLHGEQGLGDTIHFARFAQSVASLGVEVILEVQPALGDLLQGLDGDAVIVRKGAKLPEFDVQLPLMSVPFVLGLTPEQSPAKIPYLSAEPVRVDLWSSRLPDNGFRIGIAWQGNRLVPVDKGRSIPLCAFAPLSRIPGVTLISLQKGAGVEQLADLPAEMTVETLGTDFDARAEAFLDTAAVMMHLDLIITCDTAVGHLAGALGRPVWIVLKHVPDWRWLIDREDTCWYPTARLFRQTHAGNWDEVFARVAAELAYLVEHPHSRPIPRQLDLRSPSSPARPGDPAALNNRGITLWELRRYEEALASYDQALAIQPDYFEALNNRGNALLGLKRFEEALESYERALAIRPDFSDALANRGAALYELGRPDDALVSYDQALKIRPDYVEALYSRGVILRQMERLEEALASYDAALAIRPDYVAALNNRGTALRDLGQLEEAVESYDRALAVRPDDALALSNRANALRDLGRLDDAFASADRAVVIRPDYAHAHANRGNALKDLGQLEEALASYDRAVELAPEHAEHHFNRALVLLRLGAFDAGWREYEWRRKRKPWVKREFAGTEWGGEDISGKRILLYAEQGFGDTIQFVRYARSVAMMGAQVILEVQAPVGGLLQCLDAEAVIVRRGEELPEFDLHLPLMSTPFILGLTPEPNSAEVPYLSADPVRVDLWSGRLPADGLKVGISWQGKPTAAVDKGRSIPLNAFAPLSRAPGVRLISLQQGAAVEQLANLPAGMTVETLGAEFDRGPDAFLDTAAVMMNLDLIITCDTAVAHLAGALGRPVWIVLKYVPDWRWMMGREDSPWYPTARLFRQGRDGDWGEVFARAAAELAPLAVNPPARLIRQQPGLQPPAATETEDAAVLNNRGLELWSAERFEEALVIYDRALAIRPAHPVLLNNRGNSLFGLKRFEEALASYGQALAIQPDYADALNNRGKMLKELGRLEEALADYDRAVELGPEHAEYRFNRSVLLLLLGFFDIGWREYEWRRKRKAWTERKFEGPVWTGEDISGKRILLYAEQGLGDTIQFARCVRPVAMTGAQVILEVQPQLARLLKRLDPEVQIVRQGEEVPEFDLHLPLVSVPFTRGLSPESFPEPPYLSADPVRVDLWSNRLPANGLRVGIVWQGNRFVPIDEGRPFPLKAFAPLGRIPGVRLISLQKGAGVEQLADLPAGMMVETLGAEFDADPDAFLDTAAVMMNLDLVITCDTAVAHLAGALGRPVWIVLKHVPDWRWMMDRADSPWYPTARLFRQRRAGDWDEVFARIASELAVFAENTPPIRRQPPTAAPTEDADELNSRGIALWEAARFEEALAIYDRALATRPAYPEVLNNRGNALLGLKRFEEALASYDQALAIRSDYADALNNRGNALKELGRLDEALASFERALAIQPDYPAALNNRGNALKDLGRLEEALASYDRAIELDPEHAEHRVNRALLLLRLGSAAGWREYEWRRKRKTWTERRFRGAEWTGENVSGKRLLLYAEQGLGDTIQFVRYGRSVGMMGAQVILEVQPQLAGLLRRLVGEAIVIRKGAELPEFDFHLPLVSVPSVLGLTMDQSRAQVPYISADPARVGLWSTRLPAHGFRVGIAWQGHHSVPVDEGRSIPLNALAPLSRIPGVQLISLQKGAGIEQLADLPAGMTVETLGADFDAGADAFLDTAAVMMNLDLVITCDTAVAHLAGALGRPVWIMLKHVPDWRWMMDREDSPWYPTARLFRQCRAGDWDEVMTRVGAALAPLAAGAHPQPVPNDGSIPSAPLSFGELIDKITILRIKSERIRDPAKLANVHRELELLSEARLRFACDGYNIGELEEELKQINEELWDTEDRIRDCERQADFGPGFIELARAVYKTNDRRAAVKRRINEIAGSGLIEEKSYHSQVVAAWQREQIAGSELAGASNPKPLPASLSGLLDQGIAHLQSGRLAEAESLCSQVLEAQPDHFDTLHLLGVVRHQQNRAVEALDLIASALKINARSPDALSNQGVVLARLGRHEEALGSFDRALSIRPADPAALNNRGNALKQLVRLDEALASYDKALALRPDYTEALNNRSICARALGRREGISVSAPTVLRPTLSEDQVIFHWQVSSYTGWGVYGLNLLLSWSKIYGPTLLTLSEFNEADLALNSVEKARLRPAFEQSRALQAWLQTVTDGHVEVPISVLHALGNDMIGSASKHRTQLSGKPSLGVIFFESTEFSQRARERAESFELLIAGSTWNCEILEQMGFGPRALVLQGIDPSHFHPGPRVGWFHNRFTVFSGGKLEFRKAQDLVSLAFRAFAQRHPDALLVTAWSSPWPQFARTLEVNPAIRPVTFRADGRVDAKAWAVANGLNSDQVLDLGAVPNAELPRLYREMDVALFPNRCEGGTNLVAMECMACGVPLVISDNTGHRDLITADRCIPLERQGAVPGADHIGWGESDIEEIVEALETVWRDRAAARALGSRGAEFASRLTWDETARRMAEVLDAYRT